MSTDPSTDQRRTAKRMFALGLAVAGLALVGSAVAVPRSPAPVPAPAPAPAPAGAPQERAPEGQGSFFEPFDRLDTARWYVSDGWTNGDYQGCAWSRENVSITKGVLQMRLGRAKDPLRAYRCAEIKTNAPFGYGTYEARMRTAGGAGLNTALFTYSGYPLSKIHDEIDFEFLGKNTGQVQLNYFTNGAGNHASVPDLGFDATAGFNDYAFIWSPNRIRWYVNGKLVREEGRAGLPVTPGSFFLSLWNGTNKVDDWLGPFDATRTPVAAEVDWAAFTKAGERCRFPQSITCKLP